MVRHNHGHESAAPRVQRSDFLLHWRGGDRNPTLFGAGYTSRGPARGRNTFEAFSRFLLQNDSDGAAIGTDNIHLWLTLGSGRGRLTGAFESQIKNTAEEALLKVTGTFSAIPITV
jgi:hypothetical protein